MFRNRRIIYEDVLSHPWYANGTVVDMLRAEEPHLVEHATRQAITRAITVAAYDYSRRLWDVQRREIHEMIHQGQIEPAQVGGERQEEYSNRIYAMLLRQRRDSEVLRLSRHAFHSALVYTTSHYNAQLYLVGRDNAGWERFYRGDAQSFLLRMGHVSITINDVSGTLQHLGRQFSYIIERLATLGVALNVSRSAFTGAFETVNWVTELYLLARADEDWAPVDDLHLTSFMVNAGAVTSRIRIYDVHNRLAVFGVQQADLERCIAAAVASSIFHQENHRNLVELSQLLDDLRQHPTNG